MLPNLDVLVKKCQKLGYEPVASGKRLSKQDCVDILKKHFMPPEGIPYQECEPMLAFPEWNLKPEEKENVWNSEHWAAGRKLNGCRGVIHFVAGVGVFAHSRTVSVKTFRFEEFTSKLLIKDFIPSFSASIDCELMIDKPVDTSPYSKGGQMTKSSLHSASSVLHLEAENARKLQVEQSAPFHFHVFDITMFDGVNLKPKHLRDRIPYLNKFIEFIHATEIGQYFEQEKLVFEGKREYFEAILAEGGEGVILKNMFYHYEDSSSRSRKGWVKVKKGKEYDAFVTGFNRGDKDAGWHNLVGDIEFSVKTERGDHVIAYCSNIPMEERKRITIYDQATDTVSMIESMYGKVAMIEGQDISARSFRLSHATIGRWREGADSKTPDQCVVSYQDLMDAAAWVS